MPAGWRLRLFPLALAVLSPVQLVAQPQPSAGAGPDAVPDEAGALEERVIELLRSRRYYDAEPEAQRLLELRERQRGPVHPDTISAANWLGRIYKNQQRYAEAEPLLSRVLNWLIDRADSDNPAIRGTVRQLVELYEAQGSVYGADRAAFYRRALELTDRVLGPDDIDTLSAVLGLTLVYEGERRWADAEPLQLRLLDRAQRLHGAVHANVATQHNVIGLFYARAGRDADAEEHFRLALAMRERLYGPAHPDTQQSVDNLFGFYRQRGRTAEATALAERFRVAEAQAATGAAAAGQAPATAGPQPLTPAEQELAQREEAERQALFRAERELRELNARVVELLREGRVLEAEPEALRAFQAAQARGDAETLDPLDRLVQIYIDLGRIGEAEPLARRVYEERQRRRRDGDRYWDGPLLQSAYNLARVMHYQGRLEEAEPLYERINANAGPEVAFAGRAANHLAGLMLERGRYAEAESFARTLMAGFRNSPLVPGHELEVAARTLAAAIMAQGRYAEAEPILRSIMTASERRAGPAHPDTLAAASALGQSYFQQGRYAEAAALFQRAASGNEQALGRAHPATLAYLQQLTLALLMDPAAGGTAIAPARLLAEGLRSRRVNASGAGRGQADNDSTVSQLTLFADAAWATTQSALGDRDAVLAEAFAALQDSLAGAATRSIAEQAGRRYADGRNQELGALIRERGGRQEEQAELNSRLNLLVAQGGAAAPESLATLRLRLGAAQTRIGEIDARLRAEAPDYFALISPTPLDIPAAQRLLAPDEAILLAVPGRFGTHVVAVTRDTIDWRRSDWNAERVRTAVQRLRRDVDRRPRLGPNGARAFDRTTAHQLYQELIAPMAALVAGRRQIYVAAGGSLAALPFSILVAAPPAGADDDPEALRATRWFGDEAALVHIPSIQALALLRQAPRSGGERTSFFGVGNPVLRGDVPASPIDLTVPRGTDIFFQPGQTRDGGVTANIARLNQLSPLPGTADELEAVRATLGAPASSLLMAERATEPNVRSADLSRTSILLFSTHGLTVAEGAYVGAGESGLVLTPPDQPRDGDDGFLAASEVTTLRLDADWVILSACNTATGDGVNSAGLGALARSFFYAGAHNLLASHWLVSDGVAPVMVNRTLALERAGTPRAEAFRQAMHEIRMDASADTADASLAHPYYWAPFVLVGDGGR